ncbi:ACP S-malonyltransferase [Streptomyces sp. NPDC058289]|uniref:ACP S-malonyltransferase n=1 Tax=Streptomyces sp. NPDC058289 TaxID=3346425 RepID=UPI0036E712D4
MSGLHGLRGPRLALIFPGQDARRPGMGRPWADSPSWFLAERASEVSGHDVAALLLDPARGADHPPRTDGAQIATFVLEMVILADLRRALPAAARPLVCAGHGLGEYSALVAAGIIGFDEGVRLVAARGKAMQEASAADPGTMTAVHGLSPEALERAAESVREAGGRVWVAHLDSVQQSVLSGDPASVARCRTLARELGASRILPVPLGGAFHTPLMADAAAAFSTALAATEFHRGSAPVVANTDAQPHHGTDDWPGLLERQLTGPVRWAESVLAMADGLYCDMFVEVGPGRSLTALARQTAPRVSRLTISEPGQLPAVPRTLVRSAA